ncbi:hypothetical protein [Thermococcus sp.]|uniref:DUF5305 family protein n=1 Tax=Thermococcus sp. TaxID=35749 RepID=UPI002628320C|nr:hypothetical protein [Thermococcus sp.]
MFEMLSFDKKKLLKGGFALLIALAVLFAVYSGTAYAKSETSVTASYRTAYTEGGVFTHSGYFSNDTVYQNGSSLKYYPAKITTLIRGVYRYSTEPSAKGQYKVFLHVNYFVTAGKTKIYLKNETFEVASGTFDGSFEVPLELNMTRLEKNLRKVRTGTGLFRAENEVYFTVVVRVPGRDEFEQVITLNRNAAGMLYLTGLDKTYKKTVRTVETSTNSISFMGSDVSVPTARTVFPLMSVLFAVPVIGFAYSKRERKPKDGLKDLRRYIIEGSPAQGKTQVVLNSPEDLRRVFELVDRPIIHYRKDETDCYAILDGDTVYEYRAS